MRVLSPLEVHAGMVETLGLDSSALDLSTTEGMAAAIRRAAGLCCPCSPATLVRAVWRPLEGLVPDHAAVREAVENTLEALVSYGDLLEQREVTDAESDQGKRLLYLAPPAFIMRENGAALLVGVVPEHASPLPVDLDVECVNHVRRVPSGTPDLRVRLLEIGLNEISPEAWLRAPPLELHGQHLARVDSHLAAVPPTVDIPGLTLIDPARPVRYYRGRWVETLGATGHFVGRRPQAYGADLWCYVDLQGGVPRRFLDLPLPRSRARGCDEAWRLQAAIDAQRGEPQRFRVRKGSQGSSVVDLFSPVPMWAQRRWDAIGEPVPGAGCLFSYRFRESDLAEEIRFAREHLWLAEID